MVAQYILRECEVKTEEKICLDDSVEGNEMPLTDQITLKTRTQRVLCYHLVLGSMILPGLRC